MYLIFRAMWARYWCKLNTISTMPGTLLPLCKLFEDLTQQYIPRAVFHLSCLGVSALRIAFPWIRYAFVGYLEVDQVSERCECARTSLADVHRGCVRGLQVFLLWDRVFGFGGLELLPVLAASIFVFRSEALLAAKTADDVE